MKKNLSAVLKFWPANIYYFDTSSQSYPYTTKTLFLGTRLAPARRHLLSAGAHNSCSSQKTENRPLHKEHMRRPYQQTALRHSTQAANCLLHRVGSIKNACYHDVFPSTPASQSIPIFPPFFLPPNFCGYSTILKNSPQHG